MSEFDRAMSQFQQPDSAGAPQGADPFAQMGISPVGPDAVDPSLLGRIGDSAGERGSSIADTLASWTGLEAEQEALVKGEELTANEAMRATATTGQALTQIIGDSLGFVWDMGGDALTEGTTEAFDLLPEATQDATKEQFQALMASPVGQQGIAAMQATAEAWKSFEDANPQEAKTIMAAFNMTPMGQVRKVRKVFDIELTPIRLKDVGGRKVLERPQGKDSDVYNMITPELTKKQKIEQLRAGNVTDPSGLSRSQDNVVTPQEWRVVDEVKKLPVSDAKTKVTNNNIILKEIEKLGQQTINKTARAKGGVDLDTVVSDISQALNVAKTNKPGIFGAGGKKGKKTVDDLMSQLNVYLDKHGTDYQGLLLARQDFDRFLNNELMAGTFGSGRKASVATEAHRAVRDTLNGYVKSNVPGTSELLDKQTNLFTALDGVSMKAVDEGRTAVGRLLQLFNLHMPHTPQAAVTTYLNPMVLAAGLGAVATSPFVLGYRGIIKPITKSKMVREATGFTKQSLIDFKNEAVKLGKMIKDPEVLKAYRADLKVLASLIHTYEEGPEEAK